MKDSIFEAGSKIIFWKNYRHNEWSHRFGLNADLTISPLYNLDLVLGIKDN